MLSGAEVFQQRRVRELRLEGVRILRMVLRVGFIEKGQMKKDLKQVRELARQLSGERIF